MTKISRSRSLRQGDQWSVSKVQREKLEKPEEIQKVQEKPKREEDEESFLDELSSWSLEDDKNDKDINTGRFSSVTSWGSDDFETHTTQVVADLFSKIDACLYENVQLENESLNQECREWAERFPHLRITGTKIFPLSRPLYNRPPSATLCQSINIRKSAKPKDANNENMEDYEEIFAHHSSDSQSETKSSSASLKGGQLLKTIFKDRAVDGLFESVWPEIVPLLSHVVQESSTKNSTNETRRRNSDPETDKRRKSVVFNEEILESRNYDGAQNATSKSQSYDIRYRRVPSPHYMLPTVASSSSKNANIISGNYKSRVISAAINRNPRRLLPLNVDIQHANSNVKPKYQESSKQLITARLPPIDLNMQIPNVPSKTPYQYQQRPLSTYSTRSAKSLLTPVSRSHTNDALYEETDDEDQLALQKSLIISQYERKKNNQKTKKKFIELRHSAPEEETKQRPNKKMSFPF